MLTRYWGACGPIQGTARWFSRAGVFAGHRLATGLWRTSLAALGQGSLVQRGVWIDTPRGVEIGSGCLVTSGAMLTTELETGHLRLGDRVQINRGVRLDYTGGLRVGDGALLSEDVLVFTHDHGRDPHSTPTPTPMEIGPGVWIGARAVILPGVRSIGAGAVIGAGSIVTRDVAAAATVAGNPARVVGSAGGTDA